MKNVSLKINGKQIFADEGTTILEAARQSGIQIPTLCYHPRLRPLGHCRLCLVEVEGLPRPITACDNPVRDGMVIETDTPLLREMRLEILTMALAVHPYEDCLTCEKGGACELQEKAYSLQSALPQQLEREAGSAAVDENPHIERDERKCIICGRCIEVCRSVVGRAVFSLAGNGINTRVIAARDGRECSLEEAGCIFCGQCVDVCPVAALLEKGRASGGREWEMKTVPGVCFECSLGCLLERRVVGDRLLKITVPREGEKAAWLCSKGKFGVREPEAERITVPLARENGNWIEIDYEEALRRTAEAFLRIKEDYGAGALAVIGDGRASNEEAYVLQKWARGVLGTNNIDLGSEPAWVEAVLAAREIAGPRAVGPTMAELQQAGAILVVGVDLAERIPVVQMAIQQAARFGRAAIVRVGPAAEDENAWVRVCLEPGPAGAAALLQAIAAALSGASGAALEEQAAAAGVSAEALRQAAELLKAERSYTVVAPSFWEAADTAAVQALLALARSAGQLSRGVSNLLMLSAASNARGILESGGTPHWLPGIRPVADAAVREEAAAVYGAPLPGKAGLERQKILAAAASGKIKGLFACGKVDPGASLRGVVFLAVQCATFDAVPEGADVVFPAPLPHEIEGAYTSAAGRIHCNYAAAKAPVKAGWETGCDLAAACGATWRFADLAALRQEAAPNCDCCASER